MGCASSVEASYLGHCDPEYEKVKAGFEKIFRLGLSKNA